MEQWEPAKQLSSKRSVNILVQRILVSSPTFTLVNEYRTSGGDSLFHIDFYRIKKQEEVFDFGIEEYLTGDSYCFMEWPELIEELLPAETVKVRISVDEDERRILTIDLKTNDFALCFKFFTFEEITASYYEYQDKERKSKF